VRETLTNLMLQPSLDEPRINVRYERRVVDELRPFAKSAYLTGDALHRRPKKIVGLRLTAD